MTIAYLLTYSLQELPTAATDSTPNEILIRYDHFHADFLFTFSQDMDVCQQNITLLLHGSAR